MSAPCPLVSARDLLAQAVAEIVRGEVDRGRCARRGHEFGARRIGDAGEHRAADRARDLHASEAEAARGAGDQHRLAGLRLRAIAQREPRGDVRETHRRALGVGHALGHDEALRLRHHREFGERTVLDPRHDAVAGPARRHAVADRTHDTREFLARHERTRRQDLVLAFDDEDVGIVESRGVHLDQRFARTRRRIGQRLDPLRRERAVLANDDGLHFSTAGLASPRRG